MLVGDHVSPRDLTSVTRTRQYSNVSAGYDFVGVYDVAWVFTSSIRLPNVGSWATWSWYSLAPSRQLQRKTGCSATSLPVAGEIGEGGCEALTNARWAWCCGSVPTLPPPSEGDGSTAQ